MMMEITVGAYEAKTHLPRLLDEVARGNTVVITRHKVPVAMLVPAHGQAPPDARSVIADVKASRRGRRMQGLSITELIEEGRHR